MLRHIPPTMVTRVLQDVPELQTSHLTPDRPWIAHAGGPDGTGEITLRHLGETALMAGPAMFVLSETKGAEAFLITRLANAGCGFLTTTHANSARMAMESLVETALMAGENISDAAMMRSFARIIHYVVFCDLEPMHLVPAGQRQRRQVTEIAVVTPFSTVESGFHLEPLFTRDGFGEPLVYTGFHDLPEDYDRLLRRALPRGVTPRDVLEGRSQEEY
jgi:pilus assembly protein CpaF